MTHELKKIMVAYQEASAKGIASVMATVVALEGSSYRRPGVRMLILENGEMVGAVSGGCVEKEVVRQAADVFKNGTPKVMVYDGRYRLGCEGILYILIEPLALLPETLALFWNTVKERASFDVSSYFERQYGANDNFGSFITISGHSVPFRENFAVDQTAYETFQQSMQPCFRLVIIGAEHDAVQLTAFSAMTGWEVTVVVDPKEEKQKEDFPGITELVLSDGEGLQLALDKETAVVLMTHSYVKDLKYLLALQEQYPAYMGLLGPSRRREKLFNELLEHSPDISEAFLEQIHGPAGLDIGAETPQEIAISILGEILAVTHQKTVIPLKDKVGGIHA